MNAPLSIPDIDRIALPPVCSILECDLRAYSPLPGLVEAYEFPLPLHALTLDELRDLEASLRALLETWGRVCASAQLPETPGWLTVIATEYGFVQAALEAHPANDCFERAV